MARFAPESVRRLRELPAREAFETVRRLAYQTGGGSDQYLELIEEAVRQGILTWDDVEECEGAR